MSRAVRAEIDLRALVHNRRRVRELAPSAKTLAVIKANAYGHGAVRAARALGDADGFGVAGIDEAMALRDAGVDAPVCLLSGFQEAADLPLLAARDISSAVYDPAQLEMLEATHLPAPISVWLKIDSGMHRLGFPPAAAAAALARLEACPAVGRLRLMSHLANADDSGDDSTRRQLKVFLDTTRNYNYSRSLANSAGVLAWPDTHLDWVRPGIMLYGASPLKDRAAAELGLQPVMTLASRLIAVKRLGAGDRVGYGGDWRCPEDMPVGVIACGYGDGYPRHAPSGTPVWIEGTTAPVAGRVSMDLMSVDLRAHPEARVGTPVELWGAHLSVDTVAQWAGTIGYELLCGVAPRVVRDTVGDARE